VVGVGEVLDPRSHCGLAQTITGGAIWVIWSINVLVRIMGGI
jgi:hypothetical protein